MAVTKRSNLDSAAAHRVWEAFQSQHDLSNQKGQTAGVEPASGRVWIGPSIEDVIDQRDADGFNTPLYFFRIGSKTYYHKGAHR